MRHDFPSGAWAELRPLSELRGKDKRVFEDARYTGYVHDADGDVDGEATTAAIGPGARRDLYASNIRAVAAALVITGWSFGIPLPAVDPQTRQVTGGEALDTELGLDDLNEMESILLPYQIALSRVPDPKAPAAATTTSSAPLSSDAEAPRQD